MTAVRKIQLGELGDSRVARLPIEHILDHGGDYGILEMAGVTCSARVIVVISWHGAEVIERSRHVRAIKEGILEI